MYYSKDVWDSSIVPCPILAKRCLTAPTAATCTYLHKRLSYDLAHDQA